MDKTLLLLVSPEVIEDDETSDRDITLGACKTKEECLRLWQQHGRILGILAAMGIKEHEEGIVVEWEGCNCGGKFAATLLSITADQVTRLESSAETKKAIRSIALAKLTDEERSILGV